jgi:hypothetical protein
VLFRSGAATCTAVTCGACYPDEGRPVASGAPLDQPWTAFGEQLGWNSGGQCLKTTMLPAGKYRVAIRAYDNAADAQKGAGGWVVTRDFELPAPGGVVEVPLGAAAPESCEQHTGASAKPCTGKEARDVACNLTEGLTFASEGGLAFSSDSYTITGPATFTATRTFLEQAPTPRPAPLTCTAPIARCSADARVVTTSDLARALSAPSVASAFASPMPVFGLDSRAGDGAILVVHRADGKSLGLGGRCSVASSGFTCTPITDEMLALSDLLYRLATTSIQTSCPALVQP